MRALDSQQYQPEPRAPSTPEATALPKQNGEYRVRVGPAWIQTVVWWGRMVEEEATA